MLGNVRLYAAVLGVALVGASNSSTVRNAVLETNLVASADPLFQLTAAWPKVLWVNGIAVLSTIMVMVPGGVDAAIGIWLVRGVFSVAHLPLIMQGVVAVPVLQVLQYWRETTVGAGTMYLKGLLEGEPVRDEFDTGKQEGQKNCFLSDENAQDIGHAHKSLAHEQIPKMRANDSPDFGT